MRCTSTRCSKLLQVTLACNFKEKLMNQTWENGKKHLTSGSIMACLARIWAPIFFLFVDLPIPDTKHCKTRHWQLMIHTQENGEKTHFGLNFGPMGPNSGSQFFFQKSAFVSH